MKVQRSILWFVAVVTVLIALLIWFGKTSVVPPSAASTETNAAPASAGHTSEPNRVSTPVYTTAPPAGVVGASTPALAQRNTGEQIKEGLATFNDVPIAFYGRVEDQFGQPIVGAQIAGDIRIYNGVQSTMKRLAMVSDANGFFQLNGEHGETLYVVPRKAGYVLASTTTEFKYSHLYSEHFTPDANNPVVIKMWKLQGSEPLVGIDQHYKLRYTGATINFDLIAGKIVSIGGDIKVTVTRSPGIVSERTLQDWSVRVEAVEGGLIESPIDEARVTLAAPESGYQPSETFIMSTNAPHKWFGSFDQVFFVRSRSGQVFSKVNFSISINYKPEDFMNVSFRGVANAQSSRNWEGDSNTMLHGQ